MKRITMLLGIIMLLLAKTEVSAGELERSYFVVIEGTATKLGTEQVENVRKDVYLDEWIVPQEYVMSNRVSDVLLKSSNASSLSFNSIEELHYDELKELAGAEDNQVLYQGYAQLKLEKSHEGYTFGILSEDKDNDKLRVTGYYADLKLQGVYKLELICKKISKEEFLETYCKPPVKEVVYSSSEEYHNSEINSNPKPSPSPAPSPSPTPNPSPTPTPTPPAPPTNKPIVLPAVPTPVLPGA